MRWFNNCRSIEDVKMEYRRLIKKYHLDISGSDTTEQMKEINAEYNKAFELLKNVHKTASGETYTAKTETRETPEEFKHIMEVLLTLEGVTVSLIGSFIWLSGLTYPHKETIKELGFRWSSGKRQWYYTKDTRKRTGSNLSMDKIKERYGCETFQGSANPKIETE